MKRYEQMTDEQLIDTLRNGEKEVVEYILRKYKSLVRSKAKEMYLPGGELDDLIQEGMIGLHKAVESYDKNQGASFKTFAEICISAQLSTAIKASTRQKHIPLNSYVSLYEERDDEKEDAQSPLIDTIQTEKGQNPEDLFLDKEYLQGISGEMDCLLSALEKKVLYLHLLGTDYQTIAKLLDKTPKSIDNALQRVKQKMSMILE